VARAGLRPQPLAPPKPATETQAGNAPARADVGGWFVNKEYALREAQILACSEFGQPSMQCFSQMLTPTSNRLQAQKSRTFDFDLLIAILRGVR
jgi:hypothetical protein